MSHVHSDARGEEGTAGPAVTAEVKLVRRTASLVLRQLLDDRALIEQRHAESGEPDPLKAVTGRSALDGAIDTTRRIISHIDELDPEPAPVGP